MELLGERDKYTRLALNTNELPFGVPVEVALLVEIRE